MKFIDFFAGIGGIRLGLERAGHECVGFCEWDKYARQSYKAIHNTEGEWESHDIRTATATELPRADLWCFGFPCQDISVAGKQKGILEGQRSNLFFEIIRLLRDTPKEDRPRWLLAENVKNLLSVGRGWDFARCIVALGTVGYDVEWQLFNTKYSYEVAGVCVPGIPQNRERIFLLGRLIGNGSRREVFPIPRADKEDTVELQQVGRLKTQANSNDDNVSSSLRDNPQRMRVYSPDGIGPALHTCGGGNLEPHITVKQIGQGTSGEGKPIQGYGVYDTTGLAPTLTTGHGSAQPFVIDDKPTVRAVLTPDREEKRQNGRRMKEDGEPMFTLTAQDRHGVAFIDPYNRTIKDEPVIGTLTTNCGGVAQCGAFKVIVNETEQDSHDIAVGGCYTNGNQAYNRPIMKGCARAIVSQGGNGVVIKRRVYDETDTNSNVVQEQKQ